MLRLAVLASGGGSNMQSIFDALEDGSLAGIEPALVIVDRDCGAIGRAMAAGIDAVLLDRKIHGRGLSDAVGELLEEYRIDIVALAGWLSILNAALVSEWKGRVLNIHPALLPRHGGPGMYGIHVHRAVLAAGDTESGCSVHLVTEGVDEGHILGQARVPVLEGDTPESLAARVLVEEHRIYPRVLGEFVKSVEQESTGENR